jgi:hypothetical protein
MKEQCISGKSDECRMELMDIIGGDLRRIY